MIKCVLILFICLTVNVYAQSDSTEVIAEEMPEFQGGTQAMMDFMKTNVQYPDVLMKNSISGTVYLKFAIDPQGNVTDINVLRGMRDCMECDQEAKRLFSIMPAWKPGKLNGKTVTVYLNAPVKFKVQ